MFHTVLHRLFFKEAKTCEARASGVHVAPRFDSVMPADWSRLSGVPGLETGCSEQDGKIGDVHCVVP